MLKYTALSASDAIGVGTSEDGWVLKFASIINAQQTINLSRSRSTYLKG
jgi:hypothetical protein